MIWWNFSMTKKIGPKERFEVEDHGVWMIYVSNQIQIYINYGMCYWKNVICWWQWNMKLMNNMNHTQIQNESIRYMAYISDRILQEWYLNCEYFFANKVQDSMNNIETVVRERNKAYYLLETGVDGERPARRETSILGLPYFYRYLNILFLLRINSSSTNIFHWILVLLCRCKEHFIPQKYNRRWNIKFYNEYLKNRDVETFLQFYREKMDSLKRRAIKYVTCYTLSHYSQQIIFRLLID